MKKIVLLSKAWSMPAFGGGSSSSFGSDADPKDTGVSHVFHDVDPGAVHHILDHGVDYHAHGTLGAATAHSSGSVRIHLSLPHATLSLHNGPKAPGTVSPSHISGVSYNT